MIVPDPGEATTGLEYFRMMFRAPGARVESIYALVDRTDLRATLFKVDVDEAGMVRVVSPLSQREVEAVNVDFEAKAEPWASYELSDGTQLKVRAVVTGIQRLEDEHDQGGNPTYVVQSATMVRVVSAKKELRGPPTMPMQPQPGAKTTGGPEVR